MPLVTIKFAETLMSTSLKLDANENRAKVDNTKYQGMSSFLLYLTASRPDIMFSVCLSARFQFCSKESYLSVVKRISCYLINSIKFKTLITQRHTITLFA